jgi:hypothetical protein
MSRMIAAGALAGATIAACFSAPARPGNRDGGAGGDGTTIDGPGGDARGDGPITPPDGDLLSCQTDNFLGSGSGTCGLSAWGSLTTFGSGSATLSGNGTGELKLTMYGYPGGYVNCTSIANAWNRVIVDVESVVANVEGDKTFVGLQSADGTLRWGVELANFGGSPGYTTFCDDGSTQSRALVAWTQRYIKVERTATAAMTISISDNTTSFEDVDTCAPQASVLDTASVQVRIFNGGGMGPTATASFRSIELCHD